MSRTPGRALLLCLPGAIMGVVIGGLVSRVLLPAFLGSETFFVVLVMALFGIGIILLIRAIRNSGGSSW